MCGLIFFQINKIVIGLSGILLAIIMGITLSLQQTPVQGPIPIPRYLPLVFIIFLSVVSFAIILVLQRYIQKYYEEKRRINNINPE